MADNDKTSSRVSVTEDKEQEESDGVIEGLRDGREQAVNQDNEEDLEKTEKKAEKLISKMQSVHEKHAELKIKARTLRGKLGRDLGLYEGSDEGDISDDDGDMDKPELVRQHGFAEYMVEHELPTAETIADFIQKSHMRDPDTGKRFPFFKTRFGRIFQQKTSSKGEEALNKLGPGISSYFHFLLMFSFAFFLFGVLMTPSLFFNFIVGKRLTGIPRFSIGNLFREEDLIDESVSQTYDFGLDGRFSVGRKTVAYIQVFLDILVIILFLILAEFSVVHFQKKEYSWDTSNPKIEHFTVEVTNLSKKVSYEELTEYFSNLARKVLGNSQIEAKVSEAGLTAEETLEIAEQEAVMDPVADIQIVSTTKDKLTFALRMAALSRDAEHKEAMYVIAQKKRDEGKISETRFILISKSYSKAVEKLRLYSEKAGKPQPEGGERIIRAFVTFATIGIKMKVLALFRKNMRFKNICNCLRAPDPELLLRDKKLEVTQAAPPSLLKWEHMEYKTASRKSRGCVALFGIILTLIISMLSLVVINKTERFDIFSVLNSTQKDAIAEPFDCTEFFDQQPESAEDLVQSGVCSGIDKINGEVEILCIQAITCFCQDSDSADALQVSVCQQLVLEGFVRTAFLIGTGFLVNVFNVFLQFLIVRSVEFEKDEDRSKGERKLFARMFVATYINTALVRLFAEINYKEFLGVDIPILPEGEYTDFTSDWYAKVGADIMVIALINIISPHALIFALYIFSSLKRSCVQPISKEDVKKKFLGPNLLLPLRYAQVMVTIYFSLTYSSGIPLLFFTASVGLYMQFVVDKFMILNFYRTPPLYTNEIVIWICKGLKTGIIVHTAFAVLMFSEPSLFPFNNDVFTLENQTGINFDSTEIFQNSFYHRVTGTPTVFMTFVVCFLVLYLLIRQFEEGFNLLLKLGKKLTFLLNGTLGRCFQCCSGNQEKEKDLSPTDFTKFEKLLEEREKVKFDVSTIQGIKSYNILSNPLYAPKFRLKEDKTYGDILSETGAIHSTTQVMHLLDRGDSKRQARMVFQRSSTTRVRKSSFMGGLNP